MALSKFNPTLIIFALVLSAFADNVAYGHRHRLKIPASTRWMATGVQAVANQPLTVWSRGKFTVDRTKDSQLQEVGPKGTFRFATAVVGESFPLPAAGAGPAPCYCLIGKIGVNGDPFYVGEKYSAASPNSGQLYLGINDFDHDDNAGEIEIVVETNGPVYPVFETDRVAFDGPVGGPVAGARVVIFYVDGLRPDVVQEMAAMGHLPNIRRTFLDGGTCLENSFTVFPSDTITSNGSLWTGMFSDRHGIKSQVGFNRRLRRSENYLGKFGPVLNDLLLDPKGLDRAILNTGTSVVRLTAGEAAARAHHNRRTSETPTLQTRLNLGGKSFAAGVMPLMSQISPALWTRYLVNEVPYFGTHLADRYVDEANTTYAIEKLFTEIKDVTVVWLPENDTVSHHEFRGAFGMARRTLVETDAAIGQMTERLKQKNLLESTYLVLVSDHGHIGGRSAHLERFDLVNEFFHQPADVDSKQQRVGGGLGMSVRQDRYLNPTQGDHADDFVFIDSVGDGVAQVSLPRGGYGTRDWSGPNDIRTLFQYPIRGLSKTINLFKALKQIRVSTANSQEEQAPIDLVIAKIDKGRILLTAENRGYAIIEQRIQSGGNREYRYSVLSDLRSSVEHGLSWDVAEEPTIDPLLLASKVDCCLFNEWHDEETWLRITMGSLYPDSVVAIARHMLWKPELEAREQEYGVDLVITAKPGWQFNTFNEPGSAHGHPFHETMNNSLYVAGPNVRPGAVVSQPVRTVDLTPTVLDMVGIDTSDMGFDGKAIRSIYVTASNERHVMQSPVYWKDVDLGAWSSIAWEPRPVYPNQPASVNQPMNFWDLSNLTYNAVSIPEVSVNRIADDASRFVTTRLLQQRSREDKPLQSWYRSAQQTLEERRVAIPQLHLNKITLGDYRLTSEGNLSRAKNIVTWAKDKARKFDRAVSSPFGGSSYLGTRLAGQAIDAASYSASELRRVGSRVAGQTIDRWVLSNAEDSADRLINAGLAEPPKRLAR